MKYHKEKVQLEGGKGDIKRIKDLEYDKLEDRLKKLGWANLRWCSASWQNKDRRWTLIGKPPNYEGECGDYWEDVVHTLISPKKLLDDSGEILVRDYLDGPVFEGPEGEAWY